ncbi:MAG: DEAD/DEAH box helicase family protein [Isosphaerales bacterium]
MNNLDQMTIDDYFREFSTFHVKKATELLQPLHVPGQDPLPDFSDMTRQPFEPQAHVIAAAIKMLDATRRGMIVSECGTGKTVMGMLTIHQHAQRSVRRGGCNGNYRAIVLCPDHLVKKWKAELEETIPNVKVTMFDVAGKGCKHLITDMNRLYDRVRGPNGRWKKPQGAEWYILGRDQAKFMPARSGLGNKRVGFGRRVFEAGSSRRFLVEVQDENGNKKRVVARRWVCPSCGKPVVDKNGAPINVPGSSKLMTCDGKFGREIPELDRKECGLDRSQHRKQLVEIPAGRVVETHGKRWRVCECKEPLWQFTAKPKRWPPAVFIAKKMPKAFTYLIIDELHEQKSDSSGQATACGKLISSTRYCLGMTGTLIGGYANHVFPLLFRMSAERLREEGFEWAKDVAFTEKYGRIERIVTTKESAGELTLTTSNRSMRRDRSGRSERRRPVPGVMPALFGRHLIDKAIFLALEDMADNLPKLREYVGGPPQPDYDDGDHRFHIDCRISMAPEQQREYKRVEEILVGTCRELLQRGSMKLLGAMLVTLLEYPDRPWDWTAPTDNKDHLAVGYWKTGSKTESDWEGVVQPASLSQTLVYPKEQALLDICRREVQAGNQVWVYCQMTGKRDIQPRLRQILVEAGFRIAIMRSRSVKTRDRLDWIEKEGKRADIVISHPQLVQTGLDFFGKKPGSHNFNAIAFYETGYNPFTMQQAARRAWRIGQSKDCRVYYLHYAATMQQRAMALMARKMAAMMALDGRLSVEGLAGMADDESAAMALARSISDAIPSADIQRNWVKVASNRKPASSPLVSFGQALLEDEPIDGLDILDILAIEPHLIAQTILDSQDETDETTVSRDVLARMFDDFYSITDEELADLCTA